MNDKLKGIIVGGVVLVAMGGTLGVMKLTGMDGTDSSSADTSSAARPTTKEKPESVQLIDTDSDDIKQVVVTNEYGGYTYNGPSDSGKDAASITELKGLLLNTRMVSDIGADTAQLTAYKLAEEDADDLSKYGLSEPAAEFAVTFGDGSERTFLIGDIAHQNRYRYLCEKGDNDVYMVLGSTLQTFLDRKEALVNTTLLASTNDAGIDFGVLTVKRSDLDYEMVFEQDNGQFEKSNENMPSAQVMTEPIFSYLDGSTSSSVIFSLYGLTAIEAEVIFPDEAALAEYGLDDPRTVVTFVGEGYDYTLKIGGEYHDTNEDGEEQTAVSAYYCTFEGAEGKDCIFKVDASALPWVDLVPSDVITSLMTWNMINDVGEIDISGEENAVFIPTVGGEEDKEDIESVTLDGEEVDVSSFKSLYQYILTCPTKQEIYFTDPEGEPYLTLEIKRRDEGGDKIEFFKDTDRRAIIKLNGRTSYRIQSKWVDRLIKNVDAVRTGGEVEEDF